jgi:hypothetical protein
MSAPGDEAGTAEGIRTAMAAECAGEQECQGSGRCCAGRRERSVQPVRAWREDRLRHVSQVAKRGGRERCVVAWKGAAAAARVCGAPWACPLPLAGRGGGIAAKLALQENGGQPIER